MAWIKKDGGMIARNPDNHKDKWFINQEFFNKNYNTTPIDEDIIINIGDRYSFQGSTFSVIKVNSNTVELSDGKETVTVARKELINHYVTPDNKNHERSN